MATLVIVPEINAAAFHKMLRDIWNAQPSLAGAHAIISILAKMVGQANAFSGQLAKDKFQRASLKSWRDDMRRTIGRLEAFADAALEAAKFTTPTELDRISLLTSGVAGPILNGIYPVGFADAQQCLDAGGPSSIGCDVAKALGLPCGEGLGGCSEREILLRRGLTRREDGTFKGMGEAFEVASLWNRLVAVWALEVEQKDEGLLPNFMRDWLSQVESDLSASAPGEPATIYDKVGHAIDVAKDGVDKLVKAAATIKTVIYIGIGVGVVVGAYLLLRK